MLDRYCFTKDTLLSIILLLLYSLSNTYEGLLRCNVSYLSSLYYFMLISVVAYKMIDIVLDYRILHKLSFRSTANVKYYLT